jgi:hypothetical protein
MASDEQIDFGPVRPGFVKAEKKPETEKKKSEFDFGPVAPERKPVSVNEVGMLEAAARGFGSGATYGFLPQVIGGLTAGATTSPDLTGMPELGGGVSEEDLRKMGETYKRVSTEQRARQQEAEAQHPYVYGGGEFVGGAVAPVPVPAGSIAARLVVNRLGRRMIGGGIAGGVGSAAQTVGQSQGEATPGEVGLNALIGTGVGTAFPVVGKAIKYPATAAMEKLGIGRLPIARDVEGEAAREIQVARTAAQAERQAVQAQGYEPHMLPEGAVGTGEAMPIDVLGASGRDLARAASNISPTASGILRGPLEARRASQAARYEAELPATQTEHIGERREQLARANPETTRAYDIARELGDGRIDLQTPGMQRLIQMPTVMAAFRQLRGQLDDAHQVDTFLRETRGLPARSQPSIQDLAVWDLVKRNLDARYNRIAGKDPGRARTIDAERGILRDEMDRQVPEYAQARSSARADIMTRNALEEGRAFLTKGDIYETQHAMAEMQRYAPGAVREFQEGFVQALREQARSKATAGNLFAQIKDNPKLLERMQLVLGPQRTAALEQLRHRETIMQSALEAVVGNSTTARQLLNAARASGAGALATPIATGAAVTGADWLLDLSHTWMTNGLSVGLAARGLQMALNRRGITADRQVADRIAQMLVSRDPQQLSRLAAIANRVPPLQQALSSLTDVATQAVAKGTAAILPEQRAAQ